MSLQLISCDGVDVHMGIAVRLPPIGCCPIELVRSKKDFLTIRALGDHGYLFNHLEPIFCIHGVLGLSEGGGVSSQDLRHTRLVGWSRWRCLLLVAMHIVEGLQHCLHQLILGGK
jgi:hypothetical protein